MPYGKADSASLSKLKLPKNSYKGVAEWIDVKSDPFVCQALKPTPQKNRLKNQSTPLTLLFVIMSLISCSRIILLESLITMLAIC